MNSHKESLLWSLAGRGGFAGYRGLRFRLFQLGQFARKLGLR